jgi:hypothetical protein
MRKLTIAGVAVAIVGVIVAAVFGLVAWQQGSDDDKGGQNQTQGGSSNTQVQNKGSGDIVINANEFQQEAKKEDLDYNELMAKAAEFKSQLPPTGDVAPYLVAAPGNLFVRNSPSKAGQRIGAAWDKTLVYAGCQSSADFDPVLDDTIGAVWIKIRWPDLNLGDDMKASQPSNPLQGWVYAGRVVPAGHNGGIPAC